MGFGTEGWTTEFVDGMDDLDEALKAMTSMLNRSNSAKVYIGVDPDGKVIGADLSDSDVAAVMDAMGRKVNTRPDVSVTLEEIPDGRRYILISATGYEIPYSYDGWFYSRKCRPVRKEGTVVNEWADTITCGMRHHRSREHRPLSIGPLPGQLDHI
jgi:hypothetical protein